MQYEVQLNSKYDFKGENYASRYPNLHRYPATMLPQIGIEVFKELKCSKKHLLDPYCGTGSSALAGLVSGFHDFHGFDINPLAILIAKARYTKVSTKTLFQYQHQLEQGLKKFSQQWAPPTSNYNITNINTWFSPSVIKQLSFLKHAIETTINKTSYRPWVVKRLKFYIQKGF